MTISLTNGKTLCLAIALAIAPAVASAATINFSDNFSPQQSPLWSNSTGSWTSSGGTYYATAPNNNPLALSSLPYVLNGVNDQVTVTVNKLGDGGLIFQAPGGGANALLLVLGGNGYGNGNRGGNAGSSAYWATNAPNNFYGVTSNEAYNVFTPGNNYTVTVTDKNGLFTLYSDPNGAFNGSSVALTSFSDPGLSSFQVGLYDTQPNTTSGNGFGAAQSFSNFSLSGELAAPGPTPGAGLLSLGFLVLAGALTRARGFLAR